MNIAGFQANSFVDFKDNIAAVVFVAGCNMRCWYCHNEQILDTKEFLDDEEILAKIKGNSNFLDGVVVSGGEPTLQPDLIEFIKKIKAMGLLVKLDTNGKRPDVLKNILAENLLDYIAMDIKAPLNDYYKATPSTKESAEVLRESIELIRNSGVPYEFRTTVIPQLSLEDIRSIAQTLKGATALYLQQYNDSKGVTPHIPGFFVEAKKIAEEYLPTYVRGV